MQILNFFEKLDFGGKNKHAKTEMQTNRVRVIKKTYMR